MSDLIREKYLEGPEFLGIKLDKEKNRLARIRNAETEIGGGADPGGRFPNIRITSDWGQKY